MKKYRISICVAFAMLAMVSCSGNNPSIAAAEALIANPTAENLEAMTESFKGLTADEVKEYKLWLDEHREEVNGATMKAINQ